MPFIARTTPNIIELILSFKLYEINDKSNLDQNYKSNYDQYWALEFILQITFLFDKPKILLLPGVSHRRIQNMWYPTYL